MAGLGRHVATLQCSPSELCSVNAPGGGAAIRFWFNSGGHRGDLLVLCRGTSGRAALKVGFVATEQPPGPARRTIPRRDQACGLGQPGFEGSGQRPGGMIPGQHDHRGVRTRRVRAVMSG